MPSETTLVHDNTTNMPDYAAEEAARLAREFDNLSQEVEEAVAQAKAMPVYAQVETPEDAEAVTGAITRLRDLDKRVESLREGEKTPHLRREKAVDSFFFRMRDLLGKRTKTATNGVIDELQAKLHAYNMKRLEEERRAREEAARIQREEEERIRKQREDAERAQREAERAAREAEQQRIEAEQRLARARSEEGRKKAEEAARKAEEERRKAEEEARKNAEEAEKKLADESQQAAARREAEAAANVKPADMVRERHSGALNTMQLVWEVTVQDSEKLDRAALWAFVDDKAKQKAAEQWAKITNYKKSMDGLLIQQVPKTTVRR